jgi:HK97 family phage prohead protease
MSDETHLRSFEFRSSPSDDGRTLEGYAAVFGQSTQIRDQLGEYTEEIMPGAFKRSLGQRTPLVQYGHGQHPMIGDLPIAVPERIVEDKTGLYVRARLIESPLTEHMAEAVRQGAIQGMSFRFGVGKGGDAWDHSGGMPHRRVREARVHEVSVTPTPAYAGTSVALRSLASTLEEDDLREFMTFVQDRGILLPTNDTPAPQTVTVEVGAGPVEVLGSTRRRVTREDMRLMAHLFLEETRDEALRGAARAA